MVAITMEIWLGSGSDVALVWPGSGSVLALNCGQLGHVLCCSSLVCSVLYKATHNAEQMLMFIKVVSVLVDLPSTPAQQPLSRPSHPPSPPLITEQSMLDLVVMTAQHSCLSF